MKQQVNFRLNAETMAILSSLEARLHTSKTMVIEQALVCYAKKLQTLHPLAKFIGILSDKESKQMLSAIKRSRRNKDLMPL